jgi:hypothetical protein
VRGCARAHGAVHAHRARDARAGCTSARGAGRAGARARGRAGARARGRRSVSCFGEATHRLRYLRIALRVPRSPASSGRTAPADADLLRQPRAHLRQDEVAQDSQNSSLERELRLGANPQSQHVVLRLTVLAVPDRFLFGGSVCVG